MIDQTFYSNTSLPSGQFWVSRDEYKKLARWYTRAARGIGPRASFLIGIGGSGKSTILRRFITALTADNVSAARELGFRVKPPAALFHFDFYVDGRASATSFLRAFTAWIGGPENSGDPPVVLLRNELRRLGPSQRVVLVLDGIEQASSDDVPMRERLLIADLMLAAAQSRSGLGRLLVVGASRSENSLLPQKRLIIPVGPLPLDAAVELLRSQGAEASDSDLKRLALLHGCHALTLRLLGASIKEKGKGNASLLSSQLLTLTLDADFDSFDKQQQAAFLRVLAEMLGSGAIKLRRIERGSTRMVVEWTQDGLRRLIKALEQGKLGEIGIQAIHQTVAEPGVSSKKNRKRSRIGNPKRREVGGEKQRVSFHRHRFEIALSFPGEHREYVAGVATVLKRRLGSNAVFYDQDFSAHLARENLDVLLQGIYLRRSKLVCVFLGGNYRRKQWCGVEWRSIREAIKRRTGERMYFRFDSKPVPGLLGIDGYLKCSDYSPKESARLILERYAAM